MRELLYISNVCRIINNNILLNDKIVLSDNRSTDVNIFLKHAYRHFQFNYPKFYKMDTLCKLGFITSELILQDYLPIKVIAPEEIAIFLSNSSSSLDTDFIFNDTIKNKEDYFPSPALFVYTLPNIIIGEICIRHKILGENLFLISEKFDAELIYTQVKNIFTQSNTKIVITGWIELLHNEYDSFLCIIERETTHTIANKNNIFDILNLHNIYQKYIILCKN